MLDFRKLFKQSVSVKEFYIYGQNHKNGMSGIHVLLSDNYAGVINYDLCDECCEKLFRFLYLGADIIDRKEETDG